MSSDNQKAYAVANLEGLRDQDPQLYRVIEKSVLSGDVCTVDLSKEPIIENDTQITPQNASQNPTPQNNNQKIKFK